MNNRFSMKVHVLQNNLFINLSGELDGSAAWQIADTILTRFHGCEKLFIDTRKLSNVVPFGADMIAALIPKNLVKKKSVLIRDCSGTHFGFDYLQTMSDKPALRGHYSNCCSTVSIC